MSAFCPGRHFPVSWSTLFPRVEIGYRQTPFHTVVVCAHDRFYGLPFDCLFEESAVLKSIPSGEGAECVLFVQCCTIFRVEGSAVRTDAPNPKARTLVLLSKQQIRELFHRVPVQISLLHYCTAFRPDPYERALVPYSVHSCICLLGYQRQTSPVSHSQMICDPEQHLGRKSLQP